MDRNKVFRIIDDEREYQNDMSVSMSRMDIKASMTMGDILLAIEHNATEARRTWYRDQYPHTDTAHYLRKIAALCVKAGEDFGMPEREPWGEVE